MKLLYYQNYCSNSYQILYGDKYHRLFSVGGPRVCPTNPRWRTAAIL